LGPNPEIKDKTLAINWGELWDFTAKTKADFALRSAGASPRGAVNSDKVSFGALCLKMREPTLSEGADAPPRRRSLRSRAPQKSFRCDFDFARATDFFF
jgi:hypothetical protein